MRVKCVLRDLFVLLVTVDLCLLVCLHVGLLIAGVLFILVLCVYCMIGLTCLIVVVLTYSLFGFTISLVVYLIYSWCWFVIWFYWLTWVVGADVELFCFWFWCCHLGLWVCVVACLLVVALRGVWRLFGYCLHLLDLLLAISFGFALVALVVWFVEGGYLILVFVCFMVW